MICLVLSYDLCREKQFDIISDTFYIIQNYIFNCSLAIVYAVFALSNWFAPSIIYALGPKISMVIGGITYRYV